MGSKSDKGQLSETPQEKELANIGLQEHEHYKQKWLPLQQQAISLTEGLKDKGSFERERARGRAAEAGTMVDVAGDQVEAGDRGRGVDAGSGNFVMRQGKVGIERAKQVGIATGEAEDAMDDAYVQGLAGLVNIGRRQASVATEGMGRTARLGAANAEAGAMEGAARRAGNAELVGTLAGGAVQGARGIKWGQGTQFPNNFGVGIGPRGDG